MNHYNNNLFFKDVLAPTDGYEVVYAVGTTYSISMTTFITIPMMLGTSGDIELGDVNDETSAMVIMDSIMRASNKFCVFVNTGGIHYDNKLNKLGKQLFGLMDNCVFEVNLNKTGKTTFNFHPKVWIIQERNTQGKERIKIVVMSKNLTADPNLDIVCELKGEVTFNQELPQNSNSKHKPLVDFLEYLCRYAKADAKAKIRNLEQSIAKVSRFDMSDYHDSFIDYHFLPIGIGAEYQGKNALSEIVGKRQECMLVSPFLDKSIITEFIKNKTGYKRLVTRTDSLLNITKEDFDKFNDVYVIKEAATDEGNEVNLAMDIHAKIYLVNPSVSSFAHKLFLGSANATKNAFHNNVEFMIGLTLNSASRQFAAIQQQLLSIDSKGIPTKESIFEKAYYPIGIEKKMVDDSGKQTLRQAIVNLSKTKGVVEYDGEQKQYSIVLNNIKPMENVWISPLMRPDLKTLISENIVFSGMTLEQMCSFFVIEANNAGLDENGEVATVNTIVKLDLRKMPKDVDRKHSVFHHFIDTLDKIFNYLTFLASDNKQDVLDAIYRHTHQKDSQKKSSSFIAIGGLFEKLMKSSSTIPDDIVKDMRKVLTDANKETDNNRDKVVDTISTTERLAKLIRHYELALKQIKELKTDYEQA